MILDKVFWTKALLSALGKSLDRPLVEKSLVIWWQNIRKKDSGGLRLTHEGFKVLQDLDIQTYEIPYPKGIILSPKDIIGIDRHVTAPYFLTPNSICLTDERQYFEILLFSGDIKRYIQVKDTDLN